MFSTGVAAGGNETLAEIRSMALTLFSIPRLRPCFLGLALAGACVGAAAPVRLCVFSGDSMAPTFANGEVQWMSRTHYREHPVERGDVVVFRKEGSTYVKRVLAVPGDTVTLVEHRDGQGGELVTQWQLPRIRRLMTKEMWRRSFRLVEHQVPEGHYFMVGDNLQTSRDSRHYGFVQQEAILGKVLEQRPPQPDLHRLAIAHRSRRRS